MKQHRGIIAMIKVSIILVIGLMFLLYTILSYGGTSKQYWEQVGPHWDQLLNPCKFEQCID